MIIIQLPASYLPRKPTNFHLGTHEGFQDFRRPTSFHLGTHEGFQDFRRPTSFHLGTHEGFQETHKLPVGQRQGMSGFTNSKVSFMQQCREVHVTCLSVRKYFIGVEVQQDSIQDALSKSKRRE